MRTGFPVRRSGTQARKDTGTLQSSHTVRGDVGSCADFIRSAPPFLRTVGHEGRYRLEVCCSATGMRLCWLFVRDDLSAFASKKAND